MALMTAGPPPACVFVRECGLALGHGLFELALSILIAFFLFRDGEQVGKRFTTAIDWIAKEQGRHLLTVAGDTVRGVVYGILGT
ncbi:MAG: AI-2E family transporter, partial [Deltaproteobacteria bacterium]|nr:AI-2E family transporter [Nannocystaceae bacterium]